MIAANQFFITNIFKAINFPPSMSDYYLQEVRLRGHTFPLYVSRRLFVPNPITTRFSRFVDGLEGACVFDIGTGVAPLAIWAVKEGAREVHAVDPVEEHIKLARMNITLNGLENLVRAYQGNLFSPLEGSEIKADLIIGDVSGIADKAARVLGWYPPDIPTGGEDGTDVIRALIEQSPHFLTDKGVLFFPTAIDLSNYRRIMETALERFALVAKVSDVINFPLAQEQVLAVQQAYDGKLPEFIRPQESSNGRFIWRGQLYRASQPKS